MSALAPKAADDGLDNRCHQAAGIVRLHGGFDEPAFHEHSARMLSGELGGLFAANGTDELFSLTPAEVAAILAEAGDRQPSFPAAAMGRRSGLHATPRRPERTASFSFRRIWSVRSRKVSSVTSKRSAAQPASR